MLGTVPEEACKRFYLVVLTKGETGNRFRWGRFWRKPAEGSRKKSREVELLLY